MPLPIYALFRLERLQEKHRLVGLRAFPAKGPLVAEEVLRLLRLKDPDT